MHNHTTEYGTKELWAVGEVAHFEYHCYRGHDSGDAEAWYRDHQPVEIVAVQDSDGNALMEEGLSCEFRLNEGCPMVYLVRFPDGHVHDAFEDELLVSPDHFDPDAGPPPEHEIVAARKARDAA